MAGAPREALAASKTNRRANLRVATIRALRDKGIPYPTPAPEPEVTPDVPLVSEPVADWRDSLYEESVTTFVESAENTLDFGEAWVREESNTEPIVTLAPEWQATLRFATEEALASFQPSEDSDEARVDWAHDPTVELPELFPPADTSPWVHALRDATDSFLTPVEAVGQF